MANLIYKFWKSKFDQKNTFLHKSFRDSDEMFNVIFNEFKKVQHSRFFTLRGNVAISHCCRRDNAEVDRVKVRNKHTILFDKHVEEPCRDQYNLNNFNKINYDKIRRIVRKFCL